MAGFQAVGIGKMYKAHELALRYFFTASVFSEHMDDHKEIGALYYLNLPPEGSPIFLRLGIGAALCFVETYPKSDPVIGLPIDLQLTLRLGLHFSLGLYDSMTINSLKNYRGFGITISVFF